ncbi:MAG: glycosyltransferase [Opitutales bacterium]|nr:glycosyltransferase [Opitutales bacterium]
MEPPVTVSIIVPVYNVAAFIGRCVESVIAQTYPHLECIFVDDCGTDNSMEIVRERLAGYRGKIDFKIIRHERNRGLSAARNTGTDVASGEYVYYLDSDDLITPDCIEILAKPLREHRFDFVQGEYASGGDGCCFVRCKLNDCRIFGSEKIRRLYIASSWPMMAWNRLLRRDFLLKNKISFVEGLLHEDNVWSFELACVAESVAIVRAPTYLYVIRGGSIMTSRSRKNFDALVRSAYIFEEFARERKIENCPDVFKFLINWREQLFARAFEFGWATAWQIYKKEVRGNGVPLRRLFSLPLKTRLYVLPHRLVPAPLGFCVRCLSQKMIFLAGFAINHIFKKRKQ